MKANRILTTFAAVLVSVSAARVNPDEFDLTANIKEVTSGREARKVTESGRVRYGTQFVVVTEIGDKVYDLSGGQRVELGTDRARVDSKHTRVQFLLQDKDGKAKSSIWYEIIGERQK